VKHRAIAAALADAAMMLRAESKPPRSQVKAE